MSLRVDLWEGGRIALGALTGNRLRTLLTTAGIGIGVATLLAILGIIQGLDSAFEKQLSSLGSSTLYVSKRLWTGGRDAWWEARGRKDLGMKEVEAIRALSTFAVHVAPSASDRVEVSFLDRSLPLVSLDGVTEEYLDVSGYQLASGRFLMAPDGQARGRVVVLGADLAETLFPTSEPLGAAVKLDGSSFRVVGTLARKGKLFGQSFDNTVMIPLETFRSRWGARRSLTITVGLSGPEVLNQAEDELVGILRRARQTPLERPDDFSINRPEQLLELYQKLTGALYAAVAGIGFITLLVGGIGIMNIMLVSVRERTREIGVRRALGARRRTLILQFLMEASVVSAVGGLLGTAVGLTLAKVISLITPLAATVQPGTVAFGIGFSALVGLLFGIWPAARAASLDPVESLRYE